MAYYSDYYKRPSSVYRVFDIEGVLLYVGMALCPPNRISAHRRKPWGHRIAYYSVEWFPDRETAKAAERAAIAREDPVHNIVRPQGEVA